MNRVILIKNQLVSSFANTRSIIVETYNLNTSIKIIKLNNLKNRNALSAKFGDEIFQTLQDLDNDDNTKVSYII